MLLVIDPKRIEDQPRAFFHVLVERDASEGSSKRQDAKQVLDYLSAYLLRPGCALVLRRWAFEGLQTAEFIVRPVPELLAGMGPQVSSALVCRLNSRMGVLEVVRPALAGAEIESAFEERFEGQISFPNTFYASACDSDGLSFLSHLPEVGADIDHPLREWSGYLDWRQKLAEDKANQIYPYAEWSRGRRSGTFNFYLRELDVLEKLKVRSLASPCAPPRRRTLGNARSSKASSQQLKRRAFPIRYEAGATTTHGRRGSRAGNRKSSW